MAPEGGTRCSTTRPSTPRRGARHLVALTLYVVRGTRTVAQDVVCPRRGLRRYVTLTQDVVCLVIHRISPEGGATYCHILDVVCFTVTEPLAIVPRRGATI
jgi:hypothetical protein